MKLRSQVLTVFAVLTVSASIVGTLAIVNNLRLADSADHIYSQNVKSFEKLNQLSTVFQRLTSDFMLMILSRTADEVKGYARAAEERTSELNQLASELLGSAVGQNQKDALKALLESARAFAGQRDRIEVYATAGQLEEARTIVFEEAEKVRTTMEAHIGAISRILSEDSKNNADAGRALAGTSNVTVALGVLSILTILVIMGVFVANSITRPLKVLVRTIENADLNTTFSSDRRDEI
ncbi:MAG TPA: hypothetical protein DCP63_07210, partial [Bacteroidetes bacterium]|nr:hypothetical protein [Bacteroidota bacterium]